MSKRTLSDTEEDPTSEISDPVNDDDGEEEEFTQGISEEEEDFISHTHPRVQVNPLDAEKIVRQILNKPKWQEKIASSVLVEKWRKEIISQGISESSFLVAMDILQDLLEMSTFKRNCCGCCDANPQKVKGWNHNNEEQVDESEKLFPNESIEEPEKKKKKESQEEQVESEKKVEEAQESKEKVESEKKVEGDEIEDEKEDEIEDEMDEEEDEDGSYYPRSTKFCLCPCAHCAFEERGVRSDVCLELENLIPAELTERLKKQLNEIVENTPADKLDWHPGSNQQVLDIIHPSLYCYSKEYSVLNEKKGQVEVGHATTQWLPTDFTIDSNNKVTPQSYINNINPITQKDLQDTICEVMSYFIEHVKRFTNIEDKAQVIIKAANVIVTPEQGFYPGGTWHTEGDTENIVATGIFYYESQNIKQSFLEFRRSLPEDGFYYIEQDNVQQAWEQYGIHDGDKLCQVLGKVKTTEGKCIVFPNDYQHRVKHFFPEDPSKTATRKILVFFFVNPDKPIVSTSHIDNQRRDVIISNSLPLAQKITYPVLLNNVIPFIPQMSREQAEETREILMDDRKFKRDDNNEQFEREFSLCEH